MGMSL
jgi:hypothetical protein